MAIAGGGSGLLVLGGVSAIAFRQAKLAESARLKEQKKVGRCLNSASEGLVLSNEKNQGV